MNTFSLSIELTLNPSLGKRGTLEIGAQHTPSLGKRRGRGMSSLHSYVATSFHIEKDDFDLSPFNAEGGLGKMWQLFGEQTDKIIQELNEALAA